jgi:hypothetical protein
MISNLVLPFTLEKQEWKEHQTTGKHPTPRTSRGSCVVAWPNLVVWGGAAAGNSSLSDSIVYTLDLGMHFSSTSFQIKELWGMIYCL